MRLIRILLFPPKILRIPEPVSLIPVFILAFLTLLIPYLIFHHTIYTTQYIFLVIILPVVIFRLINEDHDSAVDWIMTGLIFLISAPVLICIGFIALVTMFFVSRKTGYFVMWAVSIISLFMFGVKIRYEGERPKDSPIIVVMNHSSFLDYFLLPAVMGYKKPWTMVYGVNLHKYPILRFFLKKYGLGVDRKDMNSKIGTSKAMKEVLLEGLSLAVFPEGTRMRSHQFTDTLLPFKNGSFVSAVDTQTPIIPVILSFPILYSRPDCPLPLSPREITISYLPSFDGEGKTLNHLKNEVHGFMKRKLDSKKQIL